MKKIFTYVLVFAIASIAKAQYPGNKINPCKYLQLAFENQFGPVKNVSWSSTINQLTRADFIVDGKSFAAYFDENNAYVATVRVLMPGEFPIDVKLTAKDQLNGFNVVNAVEFWNAEMHVYFIEGRNKLKTQIFKIKAGNVPEGLLAGMK